MAAKLQAYAQMAEQSTRGMTQSREQWTSFLETASRLYKYPFGEQVMIFAQRPDAKACAPLEVWNNPMNRWVKRGSKGIALVDHTHDGKPRLKYVFDVQDTDAGWRDNGITSRARRPLIWELKEEHEAPVMEALVNAFDSDAQGDLANIFYDISNRLASEYFYDNRQDILVSVEGSYLGDLDEQNIEMAYRDALTVSVAYGLMKRCGIDTGLYFDNEDFMPVFDFSTSEAVNALGTGVSTLTEQVLREVEITIKNYERQKTAERGSLYGEVDVFQERGLSDSRPSLDGAEGRSHRQVRPDAKGVPQKPQGNILQFPHLTGSPLPAPDRDGQDSGSADGIADEGTDTAKPAPGEEQRPNGMGAAHEQPAPASGGSDPRGTDLQLTPTPSMDDGELDELLRHSKLETLDIDNILRAGSNEKNGEQRILLKYAHDMPPASISAFLRDEFRTGGRGLQVGTTEVSAWWDKDGLLIGYGKTALQAKDRIFLPWEKVESRIRHLVQQGAYLSTESMESAVHNEYTRLASQLVFTYRDDMSGICEMPSEWADNGLGYSAMVAKVVSLLSIPESRDRLISTLQTDNIELKSRPNERRWHIHNIDKLLADLQEWQRPFISLQSEPQPAPGFPFITEDEVDAYLCKGSSISGSKGRILQHFLNEHTLKDSAVFLKNEYGTGGHTHALSRADNSYADYSPKGIVLKRGSMSNPNAKVEMNWSKVAKRIDMLINDGRFFTQSELSDFQDKYTKRLIGASIRSFYYNVPDALHPSETGGILLTHYAPLGEIEQSDALLGDPVRLEAICSEMETIFPQLDKGLRDYEQKTENLKTVQMYRDGTLNLIPLLSTAPVPDVIMSTILSAPQATQEIREEPTPTPKAEEQLSFFPTEQQQRETIAIAEGIEPSAFSITNDETDALLISALETPESRLRIIRQFEASPRSRETANLLKEVYSSLAFTTNRTDGEVGYLGLSGNERGVVISKGEPQDGPLSQRHSIDSVSLPWAKLQQRIAQLVEAGTFFATEKSEEQIVQGWSQKTEASGKPEPVFFVNWEAAQKDFDLTRYEDGDVVGYDKDGVQYAVGKSGNLTYVTSTGVLWGGNNVPGNIYDQIAAYLNGDLTDEMVRETYLKVISSETVQTESTINQSAVSSVEERIREELGTRGLAASDEQIEFGLADYRARGGHGTIEDISDFIEDEYLAGYELEYRYYNDRLIVHNFKDVSPDDLAPIVAHIDPGGRLVVFDKNMPETVRREIEREAADNFEMYKADAEERLEQFFDFAQAVSTADRVHDSEQQEPPAPVSQNRVNFHITDENLGHGGAKTKYQMNVDAIRILKQVENESRLATSEEQEVLSRYVGWGGIPQAFDGENDKWTKEFAQLKDLLAEDEYSMARASTLNAHYTSPTVIKAIYDAVERMGFKGGNILEPACGIGNFFGLLPESMASSKLYGVELDNITGRIAKQLYQDADIRITGFEKTQTPDALFDLAIGNVPFGNYGVSDKRYDKNSFAIHDYFFAKALDQVRPGGVIAFISTSGTLDKANSNVRRYMAQRAELLGAIRLPNNAFVKNAGTEVTTDIIFLQKRDRLVDIQPDWVHLGQTEDGVPVNSYFANHPEMILGNMVFDESMYGKATDTACHPIEGADLAAQLQNAVQNIHGQIAAVELNDADAPSDTSISADPNVRNYSYTLVDDRVYFRENSRMFPVEMPAATLERIKGMVKLRDCVHELIDYQLEEYSTQVISAKQAELNLLYDAFTKKHGLINASANSRAFASDSAYYLLSSLEILDENGELERKADMFSKRTIKQKAVITSVDTASEALVVSIAERAKVDLDFMQSLTGLSEEKLIADLQGAIFRDLGEQDNVQMTREEFLQKPYVTVDAYLSGNVRQKLRAVKKLIELHPDLAKRLTPDIAALEQAQPKDLDASEISVRLGSTWVDKKYVEQFVHELLQPPIYLANHIHVNYFDFTGEWNITAHRRVPYDNVLANVTYGTSRMNAYRIIEDTLNLKDVRVYDTKMVDGKEVRELNKKETTLAQQKQDGLKQAFQNWIFKDPDRRRELVQLYNERFNSTRPREYNGSCISFSGISPDITLRTHQVNAIAHILYGGNTLLAHEVGAGKTFEMVASAMELKRLGLAQKSLFAVPNHLTEQWASEFLRLYPSANILVATAKDFEMKNRKKFCAKIATGDYDAVIIGHSQLEKIPMSKERQERLLQEQIYEITEGLDELSRNDGERFSIKQLEKTRKTLETRLDRLNDDSRKDDVVTFEQLGVDRLFVDEAHNFKNLFLYTKMRNVAGISQTEAQKSSDLFGKCRYLDELTDGKGVIFATGTPISNSMTEMYTMQRYLQYESLRRNNLIHFDAWASTFGETTTAIELAPEGTGYRARTRFAKFHNLPELMCMFKEVADIKTADMMDLPRPKANYRTVVVKPSELQKDMVKELSARAAIVHRRGVDPSEDNMLKITSDGRKIGLDQRLINPLLPDEEGSKVNACTDNVHRIWNETKADRLTQLVFCDFSTPNADGRFNVYDDIRDKLLQRGIPEDEIAFIHEANTEVKKKELFAKVRQGKVRVLFGSTFKMGSGTNVQDRLIHLHDLDCPWRPSDLEQRAGRIVRQGNMNPEVDITRYVTEGTFDAYLYQTIENKQRFISQIMSSKSPVRSCEDVDETALSYAEIKALCAGNPLIKEKMDLDIEVARLRLLKADHQSQHFRLEDDLLTTFPQGIERDKASIAGFKNDQERIEAGTQPNKDGFSPMKIGDMTYRDKERAGTALLEACKTLKGTTAINIGSYRGLDMHLSFDSLAKNFHINLKGAMGYGTDLGTDVYGNITRLNNAIEGLPQRLDSVQKHLENLHIQTENAKVELEKQFPFEAELSEKAARLAFLDSELNMDAGKDQLEPEQPEMDDVAAENPAREIAKARPSVLEKLRNYATIEATPKVNKAKTTDISI